MNKANQSGRQTIEQQRAFQAWNHIENVEGQDTQKKYGSLARGLPAMIQVNGLAATLAFMMAKAGKKDTKDFKEEFDLIYRHLAGRMKDYFAPIDKEFLSNDEAESMKLMKWITESSMDQYRRATAEAIEYANWLKRYVEFKGWKSSEGER